MRAGCELAPQRHAGPVRHQGASLPPCFLVIIAEGNKYFHRGNRVGG